MTRETVVTDTPARLATSFSVEVMLAHPFRNQFHDYNASKRFLKTLDAVLGRQKNY
ncbi:hypothetical protein LFE01_12740 [Limosilactobacillus fermentum]|nr:hypothetical protein LFE01_12740 [Limosilactobacillus fermentum]SJM50163.1 hypothetical protein FM122_04270 [Limosilactobacillus fermentum]SJM52171.1 hypothetical protein FM123_03595 [Limosilactobacillus fermentum]